MYLNIIVVLAVAVITYYIIRHIKEERARIKKLMMQHGFEKADESAKDLEEKLKEISLRKYKVLNVYNVYRHRSSDFNIYRIKVDRGDSDSPDPLFYAIESSHFSLPHFAIFPHIKLPGLLGKLWERLVGHIRKTPGVSRIRLENVPEFNSRYLLYATSETAIDQTVAPSTWKRLAEIPEYLILDAHENFIFFQLVPWKDNDKPKQIKEDTKEEILASLEIARKINAAIEQPRNVKATT